MRTVSRSRSLYRYHMKTLVNLASEKRAGSKLIPVGHSHSQPNPRPFQPVHKGTWVCLRSQGHRLKKFCENLIAKSPKKSYPI